MKRGLSYGEGAGLLLFAVLLMSLFSACSFLYPLNPWDDANVYMTIGNAMSEGRELYVDIFDHKGPVLFFLHECAAMLSRGSFVGIWVVEVACCFVFLLYSLRTVRLFSSSPAALPSVLLLGVLTYASDFFAYGDSVEEFALPVFAHSLYHMSRYALDRRLPTPLPLFVMGVGAGLLFWMKFNLLFFYLGGAMSLGWIAYGDRQLRAMCRAVLWPATGFALTSALVLAYFVSRGTLDALWDSYFMVNIFHYHGVGTNGEPPFWWFKLVKLAIWAVLMLPVVFLPARREVKMLAFGTYGVLLLSFATLTVQFYYFLTLFAFFPLLVCYAGNRRPSWRGYALMAIAALLAAATNWNLVTRLNGTFPCRVLEMAEIVNANTTEDSEVLTFSSYDTGIYQHTRHLPPNRNFFISSTLDPEVKREQAEMVASGKIKYLVREIGAVNTCHDYYDAPIPDNYHLVYDGEELFRYRFIWTPLKYLWNLTWPQPLLRHVMEPVIVNQRMLLYERRP